jgi:general secretion pathway protein L
MLPSVGDLWRWWRGEIEGLVPQDLRRMLNGARDRTVIALAVDETIEIVAERDGRAFSRVSIDPGRSDDGRRFLAGLHQPILRLQAAVGLRTMMTLPLAAERNLRQVVTFELERRTPFKRDEICYAHRVVKRDAAAQRLIIEVTIVQRPIIDRALALLRSLDVEPGSIEVAGADRTEAVSPNLLEAQTARRSARWPELALAGLCLAVAGLGAAALVLPLVRAHATASALEAEVAALKPAAEASRTLEAEVGALSQEAGFLAAQRAARPTATAIIDALTHLLPDDIYLTALHLDGSQLQITGTGPSASRAITLLARSADFADAKFSSQVTQDQRTAREQFDITAHAAPVTPQ